MAQVGRPKALDEIKRREVCALVSAGCGIEFASRYVGCSARTIRREALRNEDFHEQLRRAELSSQLNPLKALQNASSTHWRAAAWLLERTCPERFARPDLKRLDPADLQTIFVELFEQINQAIPDPALCLRVYHRLTGFLEASLQERWAAKNPRRDPKRARRLLEHRTSATRPPDNIPRANSAISSDSSVPSANELGQNNANNEHPRT
jgi:hypothetical protein